MYIVKEVSSLTKLMHHYLTLFMKTYKFSILASFSLQYSVINYSHCITN